ncbi:MAG: UbiA family prenyltransferase, partial [Planctomycetia bacterium]
FWRRLPRQKSPSPDADKGGDQHMLATLLDWVRLLRLPNHATAVADVLAGYLIVSQARAIEWPPQGLWWAIVASLGFYGAGMVFNDVFDVAVDRQERPGRPLPSGRIGLRAAVNAGTVLMAVGSAAACATAFTAQTPWPALVGAVLTAAVWTYNRHAKATSLGPVVMGGCRSLNWLLGMTAAGGPQGPHQWLLPIGMGVYVMGITAYARDEAEESRSGTLSAGMLIMFVGLATAGLFPWLAARAGDAGAWLEGAKLSNWLVVWGMLTAWILLRAVLGNFDPSSGRVQQAVGNAIMAIITLDAVLVLATCGEPWSIVVLLLLVPFLVGRRFVSPT